MATYKELRSLFGAGELRDKVEVAVCIKAAAVLAEPTPGVGRLAWVETALTSTAAEAEKILKYLLAANAAITLSAIQAATDAAIQTKVDAIVDKLHS
jgi:hypothetical protein